MWTNEPGTMALRRPWQSSFPTCRGPHTSSPCQQGPVEEAEARPDSSQIRRSLLGGRHSTRGGGRHRRPGCASGRSTAVAPPASSPAAAPSHGCNAGGRRLFLAVGDGDSSSHLGGVNRPQAVCSDGEGVGVSRLYLTQLGPQGLREALHGEVVEGEVPLHPQRAELQQACRSWLGFLPPMGSIFTSMSNFL